MTPLLSFVRLIAPGLFGLLAFAAPGEEASPFTKDALPTVQKRLAEKKAMLVDVREKTEWEAGHLQQAQLLPLSEIGKKIDDKKFITELKKKLPADKPIYLHCKAGSRSVSRSVLAAEELRQALGKEYEFLPLKPGYEELLEAGFEKAPDKVSNE